MRTTAATVTLGVALLLAGCTGAPEHDQVATTAATTPWATTEPPGLSAQDRAALEITQDVLETSAEVLRVFAMLMLPVMVVAAIATVAIFVVAFKAYVSRKSAKPD